LNVDTKPALAIFGAAPAFAEALHVGRPNVGDKAAILARIEAVLDRNWLTNDGPLVREFEEAVARYHGVRHCVAMCNGTIALEIAIRATGLTGEVIVPAFTFVATAHALQWQEITPVFCDVDPATHNIDVARVEELITPRTTGILAVHLWGRPCDVEGLEKVARGHDLKLLFDAAHAFGASSNGVMIGNFGDAEVLSFHATKVLNSFEGGAVLTNDDTLAERMKLMRNFGFVGVDDVGYVGTNGKMTEVCAAMGLTSLESFDSFVAANKRNYHAYRRIVERIPGLDLVGYDGEDRRSWHYVVAEVGEESPLTRDELWKVLVAENVLARRYFFPGVHRMEPYRSYFPHAHLLLPETKRLADRVLTLPTGSAVTPDDIEVIGDIVRRAMSASAEVRRRLAAIDVEADVSFRGNGATSSA
jgi:dTDP-4-amino-4,6-dideoxygalactose transaminase